MDAKQLRFHVPTTAKNLVVVFFSDATGGTTDNISVAEVQMTQGPDIVDYIEPPQAETLVRCQRFFAKSFPLTVVPAANVSEATGGSGATGISAKQARRQHLALRSRFNFLSRCSRCRR
jgi:hypothetical protein